MAIPKQASVCWLDLRDSLSTEVKMLKWDYKADGACSFCRSCTEDHRGYLFFQCGFSKRICKELLRLCAVYDIYTDWKDILQ